MASEGRRIRDERDGVELGGKERWIGGNTETGHVRDD